MGVYEYACTVGAGLQVSFLKRQRSVFLYHCSRVATPLQSGAGWASWALATGWLMVNTPQIRKKTGKNLNFFEKKLK